MNARWLRYLFHAGSWILLYTIPYLFSSEGKLDIHTPFRDSGGKTHLISFVLLIAYSYFNYFFLIPRFYLRKQYLQYVLFLMACIFVVIKVPQFFPPGMGAMPPRHNGPPSGPPPILFGMNYNIILFLVSTFVSLSIQHRLQLFRIEKEKLNAELSFLKAQINPHFLFNTLNSIYSLSIEKSDDAPTAIVQLSELMRYILKDSDVDFVDLQKEIGYIDNYIALQRRRLGDTVKIHYSTAGQFSNEKIAPLLLMSFIENAFKYGVNPEEDAEISVSISVQERQLIMVVANNKVHAVHREETTGIGLTNARTRLQHLYPGKHDLQIDNREKKFLVTLTIDLT